MTTAVHVISLIHGLRAEAKDWDVFSQQIEKNFQEAFSSSHTHLTWIFISRCNEKEKSYEGIETLGKRMMQELIHFLQDNIAKLNQTIDSVYFSFVGHSLGGIIIRYCLPFLFSKMEDQSYSLQHILRIPKLIPVSYMSICTPHLGSRRPSSGNWKQKIWKSMVSYYVNNFIGKTGKELYLEDEAQILLQISKPNSPFINALQLFQYKTLVSVVHHDMVVPYCSSSIQHDNPYTETPNRKQFHFHIRGISSHFTTYKVLNPYFASSLYTIPQKVYSPLEGQENQFRSDALHHVEYREIMMKELNESIDWRRIDLEFHVPSSRYYFPIHAVPIYKIPKMHWQFHPQQYQHCAMPSVHCLTHILCQDHSSLPNTTCL